jgi:50S ribosomal subunit-associated GTPase HflX
VSIEDGSSSGSGDQDERVYRQKYVKYYRQINKNIKKLKTLEQKMTRLKPMDDLPNIDMTGYLRDEDEIQDPTTQC